VFRRSVGDWDGAMRDLDEIQESPNRDR